jgi:hypothetical protein
MPLGGADHARQVVLDQGREHDRALLPSPRGRLVDAARRLVGFVDGVDEGQADLAETHLELAQHRVAEGFGRDAGAVRHEEHGARCAWGGGVLNWGHDACL